MIPDWAAERQKMVHRQLRARGIRNERLLAAMSEIPREEFVPLEARVEAYNDGPVQIGYGQTISQPFMTALMASVLELKGQETVLEVGAGCGYAAAVLGMLAKHVITVELIEPLAEQARANLKRTGRDGNITVISGDGSAGYAALAPYDAITVAAASPAVPSALLEQLKEPGVLTIPVGEIEDQELRVIHKRDGGTDTRVATLCRFVPLRGDEGWR